MKLVPGLLTLLLASTLFAGWSSNGPTGGRVAAVVVAPSDPAVIWAGNSAGVFRSTDGGATWSNVSGPLVDVDYLAVHPNDPNKAWAVTGWAFGARLYRTSDGGATWIDSSEGLSTIRPTGLFVDPRNPDTLYVGSTCMQLFAKPPAAQAAGGGPGVFKSIDGGATWSASFGGDTVYGNCAQELALDPFASWRLFFSWEFTGPAESYDGGTTWERADGPRPTKAVVVDARYPCTHYGISEASGPRFLVSQDCGFTWSEAATGLLDANTRPTSLSMDPERSRIFLGTFNGVYRSGNGGTVWAKTALQDVHVNAIDFGGEPRALFAAATEGLFAIANRGVGLARAIDLHDASANVVSLATDPSDPNVVYAGVRTPLFAGTFRDRVFESADNGASWERVVGDDDAPKTRVLTVDGGGTLYALGIGREIYRRGRDETAWTVIATNASDIAADPKHGGTIFAVIRANLQRSRDGGATWTVVAPADAPLAVDPSDPRRIYAGGNHFARSSDGGDTWTYIDDPAPTFSTEALVVAPSNGNVLYRIVNDSGLRRLRRSDDRGTTWQQITLSDFPNAVAVDPRSERSVWVAGLFGIYHTADGGATWEKVPDPFVVSNGATALRVDPSGRVLHAAFPEHGVWELAIE